MPATAAENVMEAMISIAKEKASAGNHFEAIQSLTTFMAAIEDSNESQVRRTFGPNLVLMYCLRAKLLYEANNQSDGITKVDLACDDIRKAEAALDEFYAGMDSVQKESIRANINNAVSADEKLRNDGIAAVSQLRTTVLPSGGKPATSRLETIPPFGVPRFEAMLRRSWALKLGIFLIGAFLWAIALGFFFAVGQSSSGTDNAVAMIVAVLPIILAGILGMKGWDWFSQYKSGTYGNFIKFMVFMFIAITWVGMIPICYWTGKAIVRWYYHRR